MPGVLGISPPGPAHLQPLVSTHPGLVLPSTESADF
jgi:hypothetical protein